MSKSLLSGSTLLAALLVSTPLTAAEPFGNGCAAKRAEIANQLEQAEAAGDRSRQAGLKKAMRQVQYNCTDEALQLEREVEVEEAEANLTQRQADLAQARREGDPEKIIKRQGKLDEATEELRQARSNAER